MADPQRVDIPGVGEVEFPDTMSAAEINAAAKKLYEGANPPSVPEKATLAYQRQHAGQVLTEGPDAPPPSGKLADVNRALMSPAYPQSAGDFAQLLIPAGVETAIGAGKAYLSAAKDAYAASPRLRDLPGGMLRALARRAYPVPETATPPSLPGYPRLTVRPAPPPPPPEAFPLERYGGSTSGYQAGEAANTTSQATAGVSMPQATYVKLDDATWGIKGPGLVPGTKATVMSSAGVPRVVTVGEIYDDAHGVQTALIGR